MRILRSYDSVAPPSSHWCPYPADSVSTVTLAIHLLFSLPFLRGGLHPVSPGLPSSSPNWCPCQSIPYITHCRVIHPEAQVQFVSFLCSNTFSNRHSPYSLWSIHLCKSSFLGEFYNCIYIRYWLLKSSQICLAAFQQKPVKLSGKLAAQGHDEWRSTQVPLGLESACSFHCAMPEFAKNFNWYCASL